MEKKYLLKIEPYVHVSITSTSFILYNTLNSEYYESNDEILTDLIKAETEPILLNNNELKQNNFIEFISCIKEKHIGELIEIQNSLTLPARIKPNVNITRSLMEIADLSSIGNFSNYLSDITIYLDNYAWNNDSFSAAHLQFLFPIINGCNCKIDYDKLISFVHQVYSYGASKVNIVIGDILNYHKFGDLLMYISNLKIHTSIYLHLNNYGNPDFIRLLKYYTENFEIELNLKLTPPYKILDTKKILDELPCNKVILDFIVSNDLEFDFIEKEFLSSIGEYSYKFSPYYNGFNLDFFESAVFIEKFDIFSTKIRHNEILPKTILNPNSFGRLLLLNNGSVFTNLNLKDIGNIDQLNIDKIITEALLSKDSDWMLSRNKVKPCMDCSCNSFCPPISNYEYAIGKYNLCHVWD